MSEKLWNDDPTPCKYCGKITAFEGCDVCSVCKDIVEGLPRFLNSSEGRIFVNQLLKQKESSWLREPNFRP